MILSKKFLDSIDSTNLNVNPNELMKAKYDRLNSIQDAITNIQFNDAEVIESFASNIKNCDNTDIKSVCQLFDQKADPSDCRDVFMLCQMIECILNNITGLDKEAFEPLYSAYRRFDNKILFLKEKDPTNKYIDATNAISRRLGERMLRMHNWFEQGSEPMGVPHITAIDGKAITEAASVRPGASAGADSGPVVNHFISFETFMRLLQTSQYNRRDIDFLISGFKFLPLYIEAILSNELRSVTDIYDTIVKLLAGCWGAVENNYYGLECLYNAISECEDVVEHCAIGSFDIYETKQKLGGFFETIKDKILDSEYYITHMNRTPDDVTITEAVDEDDDDEFDPDEDYREDTEVNPLVEMGLGYIYDILPPDEEMDEATADRVLNALAEAATQNNMLGVLTEGILKDELEFQKQKNRDRYEDRRSIARTRRENRVARKERIKDRKSEDRYTDKRRPIDDKYERDKRKTDDRYADKRREMDDDYAEDRRRRDDKYADKKRASDDRYEDERRERSDEYERDKQTRERREDDRYADKKRAADDKYADRRRDEEEENRRKNDKYEDDRRRESDRYERDKQVRERREDDKYQDKTRRRSDEYEDERRRDTDRYERDKQTRERREDDKYERDKQVRERREDDKYADKKRAADDKYADKHQKKQDKYEDNRRRENDDYERDNRREDDRYQEKKRASDDKYEAVKRARDDDYEDARTAKRDRYADERERTNRRISDEYEHEKNMRHKREEDEYEDERRRKNDAYEDERRRRNDAYEDSRRGASERYDSKQRVKEDKQRAKDDRKAEKLRLKQERREEKERWKREDREEKRQQKKMNKDARKMVLVEKLRSLPLTSNAANKAYEALRRAVGAAVAGGIGSLAGLNPIVGAVCYLIPKYLKSSTKMDPYAAGKARSKAIAEINAQMNRLETKMDEADRKGNYKAKAELSALHQRLEHTRARIAADAGSKGGAVIL